MENNFQTFEEFMKSETYKGYSAQAKVLIADLFDKIKKTGKVLCKLDLRTNFDFVLVPNELIAAGKAHKGMMGKNIVTVFCRKSRDGISIETDYKQRKNYVSVDEIDNDLIEKICNRYDMAVSRLHSALELVK